MPAGLDPLGFVQLEYSKSYNRTNPHENDTDDLDHKFNPVGWEKLAKKNPELKFSGRRIGELVQMDDDEEFDNTDVVLMRYTV